VIRSTVERHLAIPPHEECEALLGLGMRTQADGRTLLLGSPELLGAEHVSVSDDARSWSAGCGTPRRRRCCSR
jgi:manganese/zinc-transporting P-type ATPase C